MRIAILPVVPLLLATTFPAAAEDAKNAADAYRTAFAAVSWPDDQELDKRIYAVLRSGWKEADETIEKLLVANEQALTQAEAIDLSSPCEFLAGVAMTFSTDLSHLRDARRLSKLLGLLARRDMAQGRPKDAWGRLVRHLRLARGVANDHVLISRLIEAAMTNLALPILTDLARDAADDGLRAEMDAELARLLRDRLPARDAMDAEGRMALGLAKTAFTGGLDPAAFPEETRAIAEAIQQADEATRARWREEYTRLVEDWFGRIGAACGEGRFADLPALEQEVEAAGKSGEVPGCLFGFIAPALGAGVKSIAKTEAALAALRATVALRRHHAASGAWPASLDALIPKFLDAVPSDPFDRKSLRYASEGSGCRVWSIGFDLADDGGQRAFDDNAGGDQPGADLIWEVR